MVNSINFSDTNTKNQQIRKNIASSLISAGIGYSALKFCTEVNKKIIVSNKDKFEISEEAKQVFLDKADTAIEQSGLKEFGLKIKLVDENTPKPEDKRFLKTFEQIVKKMNACYLPKEKTVYINRNFLVPVFHELGHAKNQETGLSSKLFKLAKHTNNKYVVFGLPLAAIFTSKIKPQKENDKLSSGDKMINILRASTGGIVALGFLPKLAEEFTASKKGYMMAKEAGLEENYLKLINKNHKWGFKSYARSALIYALCVTAAIQVKDIINNRLQKKNNPN